MKIMLESRSLWLQTNPFFLLDTSIYDNNIIPIEAIMALQAALRTKSRRSRTHAKALLKFHGIPGRLTL